MHCPLGCHFVCVTTQPACLEHLSISPILTVDSRAKLICFLQLLHPFSSKDNRPSLLPLPSVASLPSTTSCAPLLPPASQHTATLPSLSPSLGTCPSSPLSAQQVRGQQGPRVREHQGIWSFWMAVSMDETPCPCLSSWPFAVMLCGRAGVSGAGVKALAGL